jgi:hypothetical protein
LGKYLWVHDALVMMRSCLTSVPVQRNFFLSPGSCSTMAAIQQYNTVLVTSPAMILKYKLYFLIIDTSLKPMELMFYFTFLKHKTKTFEELNK